MPQFRRAEKIILAGPKLVSAQKHLDKIRGYVAEDSGVRTVHTYHPADACDHGPVGDDDDFEDDADDDFGASEKDGGVTRWSNYRQWFLLDCAKIAAPLHPKLPVTRIYPNEEVLVSWLRRPRTFLYADIECDPESKTLWCIGLADDVDDTVISVPIYRWDRNALYRLSTLMPELYYAMHRAIQVYHNAAFDLSFLFMEYAFPISLVVNDTMCMHHRCYPELEKSLGHVGSLWVNEQWHKDTGGTWAPANKSQYDTLLSYNARDIILMKGCHRAILKLGPAESIRKVNRNAENYLQMGLTGLKVDVLARIRKRKQLTERLTQYARILTMLIGHPVNCGSAKQLARYLYIERCYDVISRTDSGNPATDSKTLYRLLAKRENVALTVILKIKKDEKALSMLNAVLHERKYL